MSNCKLCLADCAFSGKDMKKGTCKGYIPMTNSDRVRAMSDEKLADWAINKAPSIGKRYTDSRLGLLDWLQQPAEETDTC